MNHTLLNNFTNALKERAEQAGGLEYALGFMYSVLQDLNLDQYERSILRKNTALLHELTDKHKTDVAKCSQDDSWQPACGGSEVPFKSRSGKRLQYVWQPSTGQHAYLDLDSDLILSDKEAEDCLALH